MPHCRIFSTVEHSLQSGRVMCAIQDRHVTRQGEMP